MEYILPINLSTRVNPTAYSLTKKIIERIIK